MRLYLYAAAALVSLILLAGSHWKAYILGGDVVRVEWQAADASRKETERASLMTRLRENERTTREQAQTAQQEGIRHAAEIQTIRSRLAADSARRVPVDPAKLSDRVAVSAEAAEAGSDGQADAGAAYLSSALAGDLRQLAADADEVAADLRTLKERAAACFAGS